MSAFFSVSYLHGADFHPPVGQRYAMVTASGTVLPGGRVLKPWGTQLETGPGPFALALSRKGTVATADIGYERFGVTIVDPPSGKTSWQLHHIWARTPKSKAPEKADPEWKGVSNGIAFESDRAVWVSEGDSGKIRLIDTVSGDTRGLVNLNSPEWPGSYTGDLVYDATRRFLYVVDRAHARVAAVDARSHRVVSSARVGRMPFAIALSPDGNTAYVTNIGVFEYRPLPGADARNAKGTGLPFPAFGFPSMESMNGVRRETEAGAVDVPALGDPNVRESNSVCAIDFRDPRKPAVIGWIRTGEAFGPSVVGGSGPAGVLATDDRVFVSNAHDDSITVISARDWKTTAEIPLRIHLLEAFRGIMPAGMAYDPVAKWLFVVETGINAVAVVDPEKKETLGHIPVGWMPTRVAISGDRVYVANARGRGTGPNLRWPLLDLGETPSLHRGSLTTFIVPGTADLARQTEVTLAANGFLPDPRDAPKVPDAIKYVVLIVKQNRSFDEVFGDMPNALSSPTFARFGMHGRGTGGRGQFSVQDAAITPNHHAIAAQWAFDDNFYADGNTSVEGHHWLTGAYPDLPAESGWLAAAGGRRAVAGANLSTHPEEEPETGGLWRHLERNGVPFRNFGEGLDLAAVVEGKGMEPTGARYLTNVPMPDALYRNTSREYPGLNPNISDQYRADQFIAEVNRRYVKDGEPFPRFVYIVLPGDRAGDPRPADGYPYESSFVADNDLALGRILAYLSHSPWWPAMTVLITEDAAQGGLDHVDAHRTLLLAAGPYVKRNYVSHTNSSFPGLLRTVFELLHLPPLHLMDATAASLEDVFTATPDFTRFTAVEPDSRIFSPPAKPQDR